jgi:hypothetical protein
LEKIKRILYLFYLYYLFIYIYIKKIIYINRGGDFIYSINRLSAKWLVARCRLLEMVVGIVTKIGGGFRVCFRILPKQ